MGVRWTVWAGKVGKLDGGRKGCGEDAAKRAVGYQLLVSYQPAAGSSRLRQLGFEPGLHERHDLRDVAPVHAFHRDRFPDDDVDRARARRLPFLMYHPIGVEDRDGYQRLAGLDGDGEGALL